MISAIKKGQVSPSVIDKMINKDDIDIKQQYTKFKKYKPLLKGFGLDKYLDKDDILAKLGTDSGEAEIVEEIGKGKFEKCLLNCN